MRVVRAMVLVVAAAGALACRPGRADGPGVVALRTSVTLVADEPDAALAILAARAEGSVDPQLWEALWSSTGYRRLARRERAMGRSFTDSAFRRFLESDTLAALRPSLETTLASWKRADVARAARKAAAYLPAGTELRALLLPLIKPQPNSFVFDVGTDSAAIFLYLDPSVTRDQLEVTLAHELHHIGYAVACEAGDDPGTLTEPQRTALTWLGAFGEGVAVLAAAGGPDVHPHASSDSADRARWDRDFRQVGTDFPRVEAFFLDILAGRTVEPAEVRQRAMAFFGDAQGPWYTIGYAMASAIERMDGREALVSSLCNGRELLRRYNAAAVRSNAKLTASERLPLWSDELIARLGP